MNSTNNTQTSRKSALGTGVDVSLLVTDILKTSIQTNQLLSHANSRLKNIEKELKSVKQELSEDNENDYTSTEYKEIKQKLTDIFKAQQSGDNKSKNNETSQEKEPSTESATLTSGILKGMTNIFKGFVVGGLFLTGIAFTLSKFLLISLPFKILNILSFGLLGKLTGVISGLFSKFFSMNTLFNVLKIAAGAVLTYMLINHFGMMMSAGKWIMTKGIGLFTWVSDKISGLFGWFTDTLIPFFTQFSLSDWFYMIKGYILFIAEDIATIFNYLTAKWNEISPTITKLWGSAKSLFSKLEPLLPELGVAMAAGFLPSSAGLLGSLVSAGILSYIVSATMAENKAIEIAKESNKAENALESYRSGLSKNTGDLAKNRENMTRLKILTQIQNNEIKSVSDTGFLGLGTEPLYRYDKNGNLLKKHYNTHINPDGTMSSESELDIVYKPVLDQNGNPVQAADWIKSETEARFLKSDKTQFIKPISATNARDLLAKKNIGPVNLELPGFKPSEDVLGVGTFNPGILTSTDPQIQQNMGSILQVLSEQKKSNDALVESLKIMIKDGITMRPDDMKKLSDMKSDNVIINAPSIQQPTQSNIRYNPQYESRPGLSGGL